MHLYASKIQPKSVTINWRYNENPPVGKLVGFYISYYLQDERSPNQNGELIEENLLFSVDNPNQIDFSYVIDEHLYPGISYNVYVAAVNEVEGGEAGPQTSISVTTLRTGTIDNGAILEVVVVNMLLYHFFFQFLAMLLVCCKIYKIRQWSHSNLHSCGTTLLTSMQLLSFEGLFCTVTVVFPTQQLMNCTHVYSLLRKESL